MSIEDSLIYLQNKGYICKKKDKIIEFIDFVEDDKRGIAFCSGWNQSISQFIPVLELTGISNWLTVDVNESANPTIVMNIRNIENIKKFPEDYFDIVYLPYCHNNVFTIEGLFNNKWFDEVKKLVRKDGKIIIAGFIFAIDRYTGEYTDYYKYVDNYVNKQDEKEDENHKRYRIEKNKEQLKNLLSFFRNEPAPLIEKNLNWIKNNIHENTTVSVLKNKYKFNYPENFVIMNI